MSNKKILAIVFMTICFDMLGIGILIPIYPMLVLPQSGFHVMPQAWSLQENFIALGWLLTCFPIAQFLFSPLLGQLADRHGRKPVLIVSIIGTVIAYIMFAIGLMTKNLYLLLMSRALDGASGGNISVAQAVVADISDVKQRAKNFGLIGSAFGIGIVFGPVIGAKLSDSSLCSFFNPTTPFFFAALLSIINLLLIIKYLPETLPEKSSTKINFIRPIKNIIQGFRVYRLKQIIPTIFLFNAGFSCFTTFLGVLLNTKYHFSQHLIANFYAYIGIMIIAAQLLLVRKMSGAIADYKILRISIITMGISILCYYFVPDDMLYLIYFIPPFMAAANATSIAFSSALLTRISPVTMRAEIMGISASVAALAQTIPSFLSGYLAAVNLILPIVVGGITIIIAGLLFIINYKNHPIPEN